MSVGSKHTHLQTRSVAHGRRQNLWHFKTPMCFHCWTMFLREVRSPSTSSSNTIGFSGRWQNQRRSSKIPQVLSQSNRSFFINLPMVMIVFEEPINGDLTSRRTSSNATNVTSSVTYQRNQPCLVVILSNDSNCLKSDLASRRTLSTATNVTSFVTY